MTTSSRLLETYLRIVSETATVCVRPPLVPATVTGYVPGFADLLVETGLELEVGWLPLLVQGARNPKIAPGGPGFLDASRFISPLEVPSNLSRAEGDVHPLGNPHYWMDPENGKKVGKEIAILVAVRRI